VGSTVMVVLVLLLNVAVSPDPRTLELVPGTEDCQFPASVQSPLLVPSQVALAAWSDGAHRPSNSPMMDSEFKDATMQIRGRFIG